jgi:hypothetical protein
MVGEFASGEIVPVFEKPPDDEHTMRSEADFEIHTLAARMRRLKRGGATDDELRTELRRDWPLYADVAFPDRKSWLLLEEAEALAALGVAEPLSADGIEDALAAWNLGADAVGTEP